MNKCIECQNFDVRTYPSHRGARLAACLKLGVGKFIGLFRDLPCDFYAPAAEQTIINRRKWRDGK